MNVSRVWRLTPESPSEKTLSGDAGIVRSIELVSKVCPGHGLVMAEWNEWLQRGRATTFGIVLSVDRHNGEILAHWVTAKETFYPSPQGANFWRQSKGWFGFAPDLVRRYGLKEKFATLFARWHMAETSSQEPSGAAAGGQDPVSCISSNHPTGTKSGSR